MGVSIDNQTFEKSIENQNTLCKRIVDYLKNLKYD